MTFTQHRAQLLPSKTRNAIGGILIGAALMGLLALHIEWTGQRLDRAAAQIVEAQ